MKYIMCLILSINLSLSQSVDLDKELSPSVMRSLSLDEIKQENLINSIYSGVYGFTAPEGVDFLKYGEEKLYRDSLIFREYLLVGNAESFITLKKTLLWNPKILVEFPQECSAIYFYQSSKQGYESINNCYKNNRMIYEKAILDNKIYLERYKKIQHLELKNNINFLSIGSLMGNILKVGKLRIAEAYYLIEDGFLQEGLQILNEEQQFFLKLMMASEMHSYYLYDPINISLGLIMVESIYAHILDNDILVSLSKLHGISLIKMDNVYPVFISWVYNNNKFDMLFSYYTGVIIPSRMKTITDNNILYINSLYRFNELCIKPIMQMKHRGWENYLDEYSTQKGCLRSEINNVEIESFLYQSLTGYKFWSRKYYFDLFIIQRILLAKYKLLYEKTSNKTIDVLIHNILNESHAQDYKNFLKENISFNEKEGFISIPSTVCYRSSNMARCTKQNFINIQIRN